MKRPTIYRVRTSRAADHWFEIPGSVLGERGVIRLREPADTDLLDLAQQLREKRYGKPFVIDDGDARRLFFDLRFAQAEMQMADPDGLSFDYLHRMMAFQLFQPNPRRLALVGLGGGSLTKYCHRELPHTHITTIEIDAQVIGLSELFDLPTQSKRLDLIHADAVEFFGATERRFDVIVIDGCDSAGTAPAFCRPRFYQQLKRCLQADGVLVVNQVGHDAPIQALESVIARAFPSSHMALDYKAGGNRIHVALADPQARPDWGRILARAEELEVSSGLAFPRFARALRRSWRANGGG